MGSKTKGCCGWLIVALVASLVATAAVVAIMKKKTGGGGGRKLKPLPVPGPPGAIDSKYGDALGVALQFFQVQKAGKLENNQIPWRGDSALDDGKSAGLDLSKGMYDAGDHIKFSFPMAFTATVLSWSILEYGDQMSAAKQLDPALDALRWITDFLVNAHPSDNVFYIQVGDPDLDHNCWERPETMSEKRPLTQINTKSPGSDVAAEAAAAMASASMVFKSRDTTYSDTLLQHAQKLFTFADTYRGLASDTYPKLQNYYNSTGYQDELLWAASWLYHATGDQTYLSYVTVQNGKAFADWGRPTWFSWDDKLAGTQVLLSRINFFGSKQTSNAENMGLKMYRDTAEAVICGLLPDSPSATASRTGGGLVWISGWNSLQHATNAAFLAVVYSDYMLTSQTAAVQCSGKYYSPTDIRNFAISQANYILGDNPMKLSYLVGYGSSYPQQVHHRGASIPADAKTGCKGFQYLHSLSPNPNVAMGALVGGPFQNDTFVDSRDNAVQTESSTYNSGTLVGLLSGLVTTSSVAQSFT
uniref:Endoglucanase n=1 Tax=Oryza punctata TaxID=4537 RepID=A0A0E0M3U7_ORYPU